MFPLISVIVVRWTTIVATTVLAVAVVASVVTGIVAASHVVTFGFLVVDGLVLGEGGHVHELRLLEEVLAGDALLGCALGEEAEAETRGEGVDVEVGEVLDAALLVGDGHVERAESLHLHLLGLQELLDEAAAECLEHADDHVGREGRAVGGDVLRHVAEAEGFEGDCLREVGGVGLKLGVHLGLLVVQVLLHTGCGADLAIDNLAHDT